MKPTDPSEEGMGPIFVASLGEEEGFILDVRKHSTPPYMPAALQLKAMHSPADR